MMEQPDEGADGLAASGVPPGRAARRRGPPPWVWFATCGAISVLFVLVGGVAALLVFGSSETTPTDQERALLVSAQDLEPLLEGFEADPSLESFVKTTYFDRSYDLEYEYDASGTDWPLYLNSSVHYEPKVSDAILVYASLWVGSRIGSLGDYEIQERNDIYRWGQSSRFAILVGEEGPFGNLFIARQGKYVVYLAVHGMYLDDGEDFGALLAPRLELLDELARGRSAPKDD